MKKHGIILLSAALTFACSAQEFETITGEETFLPSNEPPVSQSLEKLDAGKPSPESVKAITKKVADWQMAVSVKNSQRADGTWSRGVFGDESNYPVKETSGTAFFTFGLASGINRGLLDRATCEPVVFKAWDALIKCVTDEGLLGYVQPVGGRPDDAFADKTEVYGIGAFLAAGSEVYKLVSEKK